MLEVAKTFVDATGLLQDSVASKSNMLNTPDEFIWWLELEGRSPSTWINVDGNSIALLMEHLVSNPKSSKALGISVIFSPSMDLDALFKAQTFIAKQGLQCMVYITDGTDSIFKG